MNHAPPTDDDFDGLLPTVLAPRSDVVALVLLIALHVAVKGWVVAHTLAVASDGYGFIAIARQMESGSFWGAVRGSEQHPLFPLLLLGVSRPLRWSGFWAEPRAWELAGQLVSVASSILLVLPMCAIGRRIFNRTVGFWAAALFGVMPVPARIATDCLSDSTCLLFIAIALWLVLRATERRSAVWLVPALAAAGLAYLTRPEGLMAAVAIVLFVAGMQLSPRWRWPRRQLGWAVAALAALALVTVVPYGLLVGGLTGKNSMRALLGEAAAGERPLGVALAAVLEEFTRSTSYVFAVFAGAGLLATVWYTWRRPASWLAGLVWSSSLVLLTRLSWKAGYVSQRHMLPVVFVTVCWSAAGLMAASCAAALGIRWLVRDRGAGLRYAAQKTGWRLAAGSLALMVVFCVPALVRPLHRNRMAHLDAAAWLADHTDRSDVLLDLSGIASFHAQRTGYTLNNSYLAERRGQRPRYLIAEENDRRPSFWRDEQYLESLLAGSTVVARFPREPMRDVNAVVIYRLADPDRLSLGPDVERR
jgi:hypothetical protein